MLHADTKKLLLKQLQKEIFSGESCHLVELQGHAALFPGGVVLVQNSLLHTLVNGLDAVSYTHLDVYKRQFRAWPVGRDPNMNITVRLFRS